MPSGARFTDGKILFAQSFHLFEDSIGFCVFLIAFRPVTAGKCMGFLHEPFVFGLKDIYWGFLLE
jgi:hypothetical protein